MPFMHPFGFGQNGRLITTAQSIDGDAGNYFEGASAQWGPSNSTDFSLVTWLRITDEATCYILMEDQATTLDNVRVLTSGWDASSPSASANQIAILLRNTVNGVILNQTSDGFGTHGYKVGDWFPLFWSYKGTATAASKLYIGNTDIEGTFNTGPTAGTIELTENVPRLGANVGDIGGTYDLGFTWIDDSYIDFSVQANRDKFMDAALRPKNIGDRGQSPTGSIPLHFNPNGDLTDNKGTEANWTEVGTVGTATTSPSDPDWVYADLATAEASGDNWQEGDLIVADGVHFIYYAALAATGHSGLSPEYMMTYDGSTGYYNATYTSSGNKVTVVARFNRASFTGDRFEFICRPHGDNFWLRGALTVWSSDSTTTAKQSKLQFQAQNSAGTNICRLVSSSVLCDGADHTVFAEFDGDAGTAVFRVDGVDEDDTGNAERVAPATGTLNTGSSSAFFVGANSAPDRYFGGQIGYVGMRDIGGLDFNDFMDGSTPKELDEVGWTEWGAQPLYWNHQGLMTNNKGSAGDMSKNGTITGPS